MWCTDWSTEPSYFSQLRISTVFPFFFYLREQLYSHFQSTITEKDALVLDIWQLALNPCNAQGKRMKNKSTNMTSFLLKISIVYSKLCKYLYAINLSYFKAYFKFFLIVWVLKKKNYIVTLNLHIIIILQSFVQKLHKLHIFTFINSLKNLFYFVNHKCLFISECFLNCVFFLNILASFIKRLKSSEASFYLLLSWIIFQGQQNS